MTKRIYSTEPHGHGGHRRKHVPPALTVYQVQALRAARAAGATYKTLERWFGVSRYTLSNAVHGRRTYKEAT